MSTSGKVSPAKPANSRAMTIKNFEHLAEVLKEQGKLLESEDLYRNAVIGKEKVFGPNHPETLDAKHSLALIFEAERKFEDAEDMYKQVVMVREMMLGPNNPSTCCSKFCYADMIRKLGRKKEALGLFQQSFDGYNESLGPEHKNTKLAKKRMKAVEKEMHSCPIL